MNNFKGVFSTILILVLLSGIKSFADTYVVTNLNDPGVGSLRQAITNSNLNPGPDEIVFEEGLEGTIVLNLGLMFIEDDLTINGPGAALAPMWIVYTPMYVKEAAEAVDARSRLPEPALQFLSTCSFPC